MIRETGLQAHYRPDTHADETASDNLDELISAASVFQEDNPGSTLIDWLEQDGDAVREDAGEYVWLRREEGVRELELRGRAGVRRVVVERVAGLSPCCVRSVAI